MDVAASEFYGKDKTYDLNFKEEVYPFWLCLVVHSSSISVKNIEVDFLFYLDGSEAHIIKLVNW